MKMIYFGSCINKKTDGPQTLINGLSAIAIAESQTEAVGHLYRKAEEMYPEWEHIALNMFILDDPEVLKVGADYLDSIKIKNCEVAS